MWPLLCGTRKTQSSSSSSMVCITIFCALMVIDTTTLCRNVVAEADAAAAAAASPTLSVVAAVNTQQRNRRLSKEMKFADKTDDAERRSVAAAAAAAGDDDEDDAASSSATSWTQMLEDWVIRNPTQNTTDRGSRQMYNMQPPPNNYGPPGQQPSNNNNLGHHHLHHPHSSNHRADFYMTRRAGDGSDNNSMHPGSPSSASASLPMGKQQHIFRPNRPQPPAALNFEQIRQTSADISETDLYLLSAIEKLVHRVDYLEKRLQTTDKLILHLLNDVSNEKPHAAPATPTTTTASSPGTAVTKPSSDSAQSAATTRVPSSTTTPPKPTKPPQSAPSAETALCPRDYVAIAKICYHFDRSEHADWKTANGRCRSLGGHLAEFSNAREFKAVTEFLANGTTRFTNASYWLGGLNPGLLWIWSGSAKPVNPASNLAAFGGGGGGGGKNSTTVIPSRQGDGDKPSKTKNVFDIQGNGRCLNLQYNRTLRSFEYYGEDCSRPHGFVCEMRNRNVENEISRVFRALRLE